MSEAQEQSWHGLLEVAVRMPAGWCLVGGQMVHLHCCERNAAPPRPTDDVDAALDIRGTPKALLQFTTILTEIGFASTGESMEGHQHRWTRSKAQIDLLIPTNLGPVGSTKTGITGGTTIASLGTQQALERSEIVNVQAGEITGALPRPNLLGALVSKAAAIKNNDPLKDRHIVDFAVLCSLISRRDTITWQITSRDNEHLGNMLGTLSNKRELWSHLDAEDGIERMRAVLRHFRGETEPAE